MQSSPFVRALVVVLSLGLPCCAQVLSVSRIKDPKAQLMQKQYISQLRVLSTEAAEIHFPYPFYFSEVLDIDEARQKQLPAGSVRFEALNGQTVLAITGNYYISYSSS